MATPPPTLGMCLELPNEVEQMFWNNAQLRRRVLAQDAVSRLGFLCMDCTFLAYRVSEENLFIHSLQRDPKGIFLPVLGLLMCQLACQLGLMAVARDTYYKHRTSLLMFSRVTACVVTILASMSAEDAVGGPRAASSPAALQPDGAWWLALRPLLMQSGAMTAAAIQFGSPLGFKLAVLDALMFYLVICVTLSLSSARQLLRLPGTHPTLRWAATGVRKAARLGCTAFTGCAGWQVLELRGGLEVDATIVVLLVQLLLGLVLPLIYIFVSELRAKRAWLNSIRGPHQLLARAPMKPQCSRMAAAGVAALMPAFISMNIELLAYAVLEHAES